MVLNFNLKRAEALALMQEFNRTSRTYQRSRLRVSLMLPVLLLAIWVFNFVTDGFSWVRTAIFVVIALLWFFFYPSRFDKAVKRSLGKFIDEGEYHRTFGSYELTLSDRGIDSEGPQGGGSFYWDAVERILLTDAYLFVFIQGAKGFAISVADIGSDRAQAAYDYINTRMQAARAARV